MSSFFSLVSAGDGKALYFDAKIRQKIKNKELDYGEDSHSSISSYYGYQGEKEDILNKYEYNPITRIFKIDQKNNPIDDSEIIKKFCDQLDFKTVVPKLNVHQLIDPFKDFSIVKTTEKDLKLLKKWISIRASVENSIGDSVWDSVRASVGNSIGNSIMGSIGNWVEASSIGNSIMLLIGDSVWAYISSFFNLKRWRYIKHKKGENLFQFCVNLWNKDWKYIKHNKRENPFQSCIDLWNRGIIPSFDGKNWRLHGKDGKEIYKEIKN